MNYKEMTVEQIAKVIRMYENEAYDTMKLYEKAFGKDDSMTKRVAHKWSSLYDLCYELGINTVE